MSNLFPIQLFVGLGNPGEEYAATRHNAGVWFIEALCKEWGLSLQFEAKFHGTLASTVVAGHKVRLLVPTTFMNASGQAVRAVSQFYQIPPNAILVAHDELDFSPGTVRLKQEGGHGGHNGLRDIIQHLHTDHFNRLRIGIGHPGHRNLVHNYVLTRPGKSDQEHILNGITHSFSILDLLLKGDIQAAMTQLHT